MNVGRFLDLRGRSHVGSVGDRDDVVVWCRGPIERATSAVLLLHDRIGNARSWDLVMARLPAAVAVVAVDLRGRGSAWQQAPSAGIATHVGDLTDLLDRLDVDEVIAVGSGLGAVVASELAQRAPDRVARTVGVLGEPADETFDDVIGLAFPDRAEHVRFWRQHPRFADADAGAIDRFVTHGVAGPEHHHRWRVDVRSLAADDRASATTKISLSRTIRFSSASAPATHVIDRTTTLVTSVDPAIALLSAAGADAVAAQIQSFLR